MYESPLFIYTSRTRIHILQCIVNIFVIRFSMILHEISFFLFDDEMELFEIDFLFDHILIISSIVFNFRHNSK